jgi:hypothetical protein
MHRERARTLAPTSYAFGEADEAAVIGRCDGDARRASGEEEARSFGGHALIVSP